MQSGMREGAAEPQGQLAASGGAATSTPPRDDGAADHLPGATLPPIELPATDGHPRRVDRLAPRAVLFVYPSIGGPRDKDFLDEWTALPGARGCTPEACGFRDELAGFKRAGVSIFGLSSQAHEDQLAHAEKLQLPYPLLADEALSFGEAHGLPVFEFHGQRFYKRLTLITVGHKIEAALYPVFPPEAAAAHALSYLHS